MTWGAELSSRVILLLEMCPQGTAARRRLRRVVLVESVWLQLGVFPEEAGLRRRLSQPAATQAAFSLGKALPRGSRDKPHCPPVPLQQMGQKCSSTKSFGCSKPCLVQEMVQRPPGTEHLPAKR